MLQYCPKVSIVIPAYNASNYLAEAIDSALGQNYENIEIIVVNDGSKDNGKTREVALSYGEKIRYLEKENGGSSSALNEGIRNMTGEWFSWLSHDDLYLPDKIKKQIDYINGLDLQLEEIERYVLFTGYESINAEGKTIRKQTKKFLLRESERIKNICGNEELVAEPTKNIFHGCSCLVHKKVFEDIGYFDEKLRLINDCDLWMRIYISGYKIFLLPEILVKGRVHSNQISNRVGFSYHNKEQDEYWNSILEWLKTNYSDRFDLFFMFGKNAYLKTRMLEGNEAFKIASDLKESKKIFLSIIRKKIIFCSTIRNLFKKLYLIIRL